MTQTPESRLREAVKQAGIALEDIDDRDRCQQVRDARGDLQNVANELAVDEADQELTGGTA